MKQGRKPIPTKLKLVNGNPGHRPLSENEPQPEPALPTCPSFLSAPAKAEWKRIAPKLRDLGLLTHLDRAALAAYCQAFGRWREAEEGMSSLLVKTKQGGVIQNPLLGIANRAMEQMNRSLTEFGMTPSSRTRVAAAQNHEDDQEKQKYFTGSA